MAISKNAHIKKEAKFQAKDLSTREDMVVGVLEVPHEGLSILAKDEQGYYLTKSSFVGAKMLDPYRDKSRSRVDSETAEQYVEGDNE